MTVELNIGTVFGVPGIVTRGPRQFPAEWVVKVVYDPAYDYVVVYTNQSTDDDHSVSDSVENGRHLEWAQRAPTGELTQSQFHIVQWDASEEEAGKVGNEEGTWEKCKQYL